MAKLTSVFTFSGSLDGISVYKMEGVDKPVMRRKGGAKKEKILHDPCFENTRRVNKEFGGRSAASAYLLEATNPLRPGHGITGRMNKVLTALQKLDTTSPWGRRAVTLSLCPQLLQGFDLSKRLTLDTVLQTPLYPQLSRGALQATLNLPALLPGINCTHPKMHPYFRIVTVLGVMPDLDYSELLDSYEPQEGFERVPAQSIYTPWLQTNKSSEATTLDLSLSSASMVTGFSLVLSVAVQYGRLDINGQVEPLPKAVASRIVAVV